MGGFTVLMALYGDDRVELFEAAVHSVFANTLLPNQFLIIVDGPIPSNLRASLQILETRYPLLEFVHLHENKGLAKALNIGLQLVKFVWVLRADADDINLPERFATLAAVCKENPKVKLVGSAILEVDEDAQPLAIRELPCTAEEIHRFAKTRNPFNHMTVAYHLDAVLDCGGYPNIHLKEDYGLWCLFLVKGYAVMNIKTILVHATTGMSMYRRRGGLRYAKSEWQMQCLMVQCGLKNHAQAVLDGIVRSGFFLIPSSLRGLIYRTFLRKSIS